MVAAYSNRGADHANEIEKLIREYGIGGLIFFQGGPQRQARLTNRYQAASKIPLMIGMDAEWGLSMRLDSTMSFPYQMTLGAVQDMALLEQMGKAIGRQCRRLGVHISFSPVADINSNPANPVIGYRSFGEDKEAVSRRAAAFARGLQAESVMAVAKHFPGHGDADADSHYSLPLIRRSAEQIRSTELHPFRAMKDSVGGVMVAHLSIPSLDSRENTPGTVSKIIVSDLLRKEIGFEGLIFTDALNMKGLSKFFKPGEADLKALQAGNDVLLFPEDVPKAIRVIEDALNHRQLSWPEIEKHVKRILAWKHKLGLYYPQVTELKNLPEDLQRREDHLLNRKIYAAAVTIARNQNQLLPIRKTENIRFASILIGQEDPGNSFQKGLSLYAPFQHYRINEKAGAEAYRELARSVKADVIVVAFARLSNSLSKKFGVTSEMQEMVKTLEKNASLISVHFGNAYSTGEMDHCPAVVSAFEWNEHTRSLVPELIFGAIPAKGRMPVSAGKNIRFGIGFSGSNLQRLHHAEPEEIGAIPEFLRQIDSLAVGMIARRVTPGCQILAAKDGAVFYHKSFGYQTYEKQEAVNDETLYDIASVTKVAATLQAIMYLYEQGRIQLSDKASDYLPELRGTNKEHQLISEILAHQAGLIPFIPHWKKTIKPAEKAEIFFCNEKDDNWFCTEVVPGLYSMRSMEDSIWQWTIRSELLPRNEFGLYNFKYSDIGFYILKMLAERVLQEPIAVFLDRKFYKPLGQERICFQPKKYFPESQIAPTEKDTEFRKALVRGNVHDQGAAMFGGISGHAGLFANAWSLAVLMQMNLNLGFYGGSYHFLPQTLPTFSCRPFDGNHRGLGWDKPFRSSREGPVSRYASQDTFGHLGFTGTCVWADPSAGLLFVFLSNRVYPDADNNRLSRERIRPGIHDLLYQAIAKTNPVQEGN